MTHDSHTTSKNAKSRSDHVVIALPTGGQSLKPTKHRSTPLDYALIFSFFGSYNGSFITVAP
jgi:hypothetical protein